jgi:predicted  nucleic acid-binding Zn-ribbon protein
MDGVLETLLELEKRSLNPRRSAAGQEAELNALRAQVPAAALKQFDRLVSRGKKAVAVAAHGVCSGCHLQVTRATLVELTHHDSLPKCGNCGRFLILPDAELAGAAPSQPPAGKAARARRTHAG